MTQIDFTIILVAYLIIKMGYMVSFNSLFHLISLKGKEINGTYLDRFTRTAGFSLIFLGITTGSLVFFKKYFPEFYIYGYIAVVLATIVFLLIKLRSYKNTEKELLNHG